MSDRDKRNDSEGPTTGEPFGQGHEDFLQFFKKGLKFSEELLAENEKLRFRIAALESQLGTSEKTGAANIEATVTELKRRVDDLEGERQRLIDSFREVESLNADYHSRYTEIEDEHNNLANLYIASYQLHATLSFRDIMQVVAEVVINLVGVQRFAIYLHDETAALFTPVFAEGQDLAGLTPVKMGEGVVGKAAQAKIIAVSDGKEGRPLAVVPLATGEALVGLIVIDELLVQKQSFSRMDHELFTLLGAHAATAMVSGLMRERFAPDSVTSAIDVNFATSLLVGAPGTDGRAR